MRVIIITIFLLIFINSFGQNQVEKYFEATELVIRFSDKIPQAPRISPDGNKLLYELYSGGDCEIILCNSDGTDKVNLTKGVIERTENAFWHPSQKYIAFNQLPDGKIRRGQVYVAALEDNKIGKALKIDKGARAQFSKPNGNVIFYERTNNFNTTIKYRILGPNPTEPVENTALELRGPIQEISDNHELSHPSLAPDGTTILFAARTSTGGSFMNELNITDGNRQRAIELWNELVKRQEVYTLELLQTELDKYIVDTNNLFTYNVSHPFLYKENDYEINRIKNIISNSGSKVTLMEGYSQKDFLIAWLLGLFEKYDVGYSQEIQSILYSRIWMTDIFGANIVPLVPDEANIPLPQKWSTVSSSGEFAVFEAGHYKNRQIYLISMKTKKVVQLTYAGTYNSSPDISTDEKWLYFETNRTGKKEIWRAKLNIEKIKNDIM